MPNSGGGVSLMADESYIRNLRTSLAARVRADEEQTKKENRESDLIKGNAPKTWQELKGWLREAVAELNRGAGEFVTYSDGKSENEVSLRCNIGRQRWDLKVGYFDLFGGATITASGKKFEVKFQAELEGKNLYWRMDGDGVESLDRYTVEDIGKLILDTAVGV
jgi:hypothetical protein